MKLIEITSNLGPNGSLKRSNKLRGRFGEIGVSGRYGNSKMPVNSFHIGSNQKERERERENALRMVGE
jgi:hypothetical protein